MAGSIFKGERVGLVHINKTARASGGFFFSSHTNLKLSAFGTSSTLSAKIKASVDASLALQSVDFDVRTGPAVFTGTGLIEDKSLAVSLKTGQTERTFKLPFKRPPVLRSLVGPVISRANLVPGHSMTVPVFDPVTQKNQDMTVTIVGPDTVIILDKEYPAIHIRQSVAGLTLNGWINERGEMLRQELGLGLVAIRETKARARAGTLPSTKGANLVEATMIPISGLPKTLTSTDRITFRIHGVDIANFKLTDRRQSLNGDRLTIQREKLGRGLSIPVTQPKYKSALRSRPLIQSDHPRIKTQAKAIIGDAQDTLVASQRIYEWIGKNMTQKPVAGIPSALESLDTRIGDCNEHSTLFAALARASGIPTRIVIGLVYKDGLFGYHAWNEVLTNEGWVSVDPTWQQFPADVGHIALLRGGLAEQVRLLPLMGRLKIDRAPLKD